MRNLMMISAALLAAAALSSGQTVITLTNPGFEAMAIPNGNFALGAPTGWTAIPQVFPGASAASSSIIYTEDSDIADYVLEAPEGENYCTLYNDAGIQQTVTTTITPGKSYILAYRCANYPASAGNRRIGVRFLINGTEVLSEVRRTPTTNGIWVRNIVGYTHPTSSIPASSLTIEIRLAEGVAGSRCSIDDVELLETNEYSGFNGGYFPEVSFEVDPVGTFLSLGAFNQEKVRAEDVAGRAEIRNSGAAVFPQHGSKFIELSNYLTGPGGSAPKSTVAFGTYVAGKALRFVAQMFTNESIPSGTQYNDRCYLDIFDVSSGSEVLLGTLTVFETNNPAQWTATTSNYTSNISGIFSSSSTPIAVSYFNPALTPGQPVIFKFRIENGGDDSVPSCVLIDNISWLDDVRRPGTSDGLLMATGVDSQCSSCIHYGELSGGAGNDEKSIGAGDVLHVGIDTTNQNLFGAPILLAAQFFTTGGAEPTPIPTYSLWLGTGATLLINGAQPSVFGQSSIVLPGGMIRSFFVPFGFNGFSMILQTVVPSTLSANGIIAASEAHLIRFQ